MRNQPRVKSSKRHRPLLIVGIIAVVLCIGAGIYFALLGQFSATIVMFINSVIAFWLSRGAF